MVSVVVGNKDMAQLAPFHAEVTEAHLRPFPAINHEQLFLHIEQLHGWIPPVGRHGSTAAKDG
jgi:hypothetical protein